MISGAHVVIHSRDAEADRAFLRDALGLSHVDAGHGWLIFALPPSEVAVHPADTGGSESLYFLCDDLDGTIAALAKKDVVCEGLEMPRWGRVTRIRLPGGGTVGLYQPSHPRP